ncbi:MAG: hypothetical protein A2144_11180 [Chloroflexi bacterium RBG_16_50_9]|nr:MAG: hypothetical protein A2144_11180 [Chloroflexi bacterium RBG_16_50_9]
MPKVSVITPTYNRAHLISQSIQSVLNQTFSDFEIIIVDDGSTDNTREVLDSFKDPRIKYTWQENGGPSVARNTGIKASSGDYIVFLDSDDVLVRNALEKGVRVLDAHPEVGFSYGQAYLMDERGRVFGFRKHRDRGSHILNGIEEIRKAIVNGNHIPTSTIMARRSCLEEVGTFDDAFRYGSEDFDLLVRLARLHSVAYIAEPLIKYRVHIASISCGRRLAEMERSIRFLLERIFNDPELSLLFSSERPDAYLHMNLRLSDCAYGTRQMRISRRYLFQAAKVQPGWFFKRLWLPLIIRLCKTWLPLKALDLAHKAKRFVRITAFAYILKPQVPPATGDTLRFVDDEIYDGVEKNSCK